MFKDKIKRHAAATIQTDRICRYMNYDKLNRDCEIDIYGLCCYM